MLFGRLVNFAIECEIRDQIERELFGKFVFWAGGQLIGDPNDYALLRGCVNYLGEFVAYRNERREVVFDTLGSDEVFELVHTKVLFPSAVVGDSGAPDANQNLPLRNSRERFHLDSVGMSAFWDTVQIILVERSNGGQRLIWRSFDDKVLHEVELAPSTFEAVAESFLTWIKGEL